MKRQIFAWDCSRSKRQQRERWLEWGWIVGLLLAALVLFTVNLGNLPLGDREIESVARAARAIWESAGGEGDRGLFVSFQSSSPFAGVVALFYAVGGVNAGMTRLPGALLAALSVPCLYSVGREVFPSRLPALFSALLYLTFWPVVRSGRLAALGGPILCFTLLALLCLLRSRRDLRWSLGAGASLGLLSFTHSTIGLLVGAIALLFLVADTPRLLSSPLFGLGLCLGSGPALIWHVSRWRSATAGLAIGEWIWQQLARPASPQLLWLYSRAILFEAWPWLLFSLYGFGLAKTQWNWSWAKLVLIWSGAFCAIAFLSGLAPAEAILPLYPAFALAGGAILAETHNLPHNRPYPTIWKFAFILIALSVMGACLAIGIASGPDYTLLLTLASVALTLAVAATLIERQERQFTIVLFWGAYVSLLLLASSPYWISDFNPLDRQANSTGATSIETVTPVLPTIANSYANC